ncbi:MAG TPA: tRNA lysidine(34) synthetase TilS [Chlamydiales bacterium]|nr:tRNA lysidine(34) synthetase TilS [Chlamydiales bacterium]
MIQDIPKMIQECVANFLGRNWDGCSPLLLGYSGGPDSKALLYALLESGCTRLHLAHVDHGWRLNSREEALQLEEEAEALNLPFHMIRLEPIMKNREAAARKQRLAFFHSLFRTIPFQALLLAHHADDLAETVLKRIFEGAHLCSLGAMEPISKIEEMNIWRPLLSIKKTETIAFLECKGLHPLIDETNFDPQYLRSRMRMKILPYLSQLFGKEITENLLFLQKRGSELEVYLNQKTQDRLPSVGPWGLCGFLSDLARLEARHLLLAWSRMQQILLPRSLLEKTLDAIYLHIPNRRISERIVVDRGYVFFLAKKRPSFGQNALLLHTGLWRFGDWEVEINNREANIEEIGWQGIWRGDFTVAAPKGCLRMPHAKDRLRRLWNEKKVPAFIRCQIPVVEPVIEPQIEIGCKVKEFLSGNTCPDHNLLLSFRFIGSKAPENRRSLGFTAS